jgi:hypothetical protein
MGRESSTSGAASITLPYRFDTSSVWRTILKGAFGLNALLVLAILFTVLVSREWPKAFGLVVVELVVFFFTRVFVRFQTGSVGTLSADRIVVEPNVLFGITLPGPNGTYPLDQFSTVRVEFHSGPVTVGAQGGPNELIWLVGKAGTPNIVVARTEDRAGRAVGQEFGALLGLPVEEVGAPIEIRL